MPDRMPRPAPADADPLAREPFFAAVHRRRPDVDLVVLPPDPGPPERRSGEPATAELLACLVAAVEGVAATLAPSLPDGAGTRSLWEAAGPAAVRRRLTTSARVDDPSGWLGGVARTLEDAGWQLRTTSGAFDRLVARRHCGPDEPARGRLELVATAAPTGAVTVSARSVAAVVEPRRLAVLVGERRGGDGDPDDEGAPS
ncbi:hypothetical protein [Nocardioides sp. KR10-350]|uniref:hypothetical protein n=1 Tax=Nocardioides cheoyonin TaxID=3156615 RepID=UPI0032B5592C